MKKVAYGVNGYGRGHVTRARTILPELTKKADVLVFAGEDAYHFLREDYNTVEVPVMDYHFKKRGVNPSMILTTCHTIPKAINLALGRVGISTGGVGKVIDRVKEFDPDLVVSDFDTWTKVAAKMNNLPLISIDHGAVLAYCDLDIPQKMKKQVDSLGRGYKAIHYLLGGVDKTIAAGFFPATPRDETTDFVGPIIRPEIKGKNPTNNGKFLVYMNKPQAYTQKLEECLGKLDAEVIVYGAPRECENKNIAYKKLHPIEFTKDFKACRALVTRGGNQIMAESIYLGKPVISLPENHIEQRLNAHFAEKMGFAVVGNLKKLSMGLFEDFLEKEDQLRENSEKLPSEDGTSRAVGIIQAFPQNL
jgi:uncharacterized protein (TIGR00661 family)